MKKTFALVLLALVAGSVLAGPDKNAAKTPKTIKCVVTGDTVTVADAVKKHMYSDYKGRRYFFCCDGCPQSFAKNPAKYSKGPSIATPKATKAPKKS